MGSVKLNDIKNNVGNDKAYKICIDLGRYFEFKDNEMLSTNSVNSLKVLYLYGGRYVSESQELHSPINTVVFDEISPSLEIRLTIEQLKLLFPECTIHEITIYDDQNYKAYVNGEIAEIRKQFAIRNADFNQTETFINTIYENRGGQFFPKPKYTSIEAYDIFDDRSTKSKLKKDWKKINSELSQYFSVHNIYSNQSQQLIFNNLLVNTDDKLRENIATTILTRCGYTVEKTLGAGSFNIVIKCKNPKGKDVACKVALANAGNINEERILNNERKFMTEFDALDFNGFPEEVAIEVTKKSDKYTWKKYSDRVTLKIDDIFDIKGPLGVTNIHALISETRLMESDMWNAYTLHRTGGLNEIRRMGKAVLKVLKIIHAKGMAHLDIKPGNILQNKISESKTRYKLTDFGLSVDKTTCLTGHSAGTPGFVAPDVTDNGLDFGTIKYGVNLEQLQKCDIYALGVSMFDLYLTMHSTKVGEPVDWNYRGTHKNRRAVLRQCYDYYTKYSKLFPQEYIFLSLIRRMMATKHEKRPTADKCLQDAFFSKPPVLAPALKITYTYNQPQNTRVISPPQLPTTVRMFYPPLERRCIDNPNAPKRESTFEGLFRGKN